MKRPGTLVATLGGQPQVVTYTLDLLIREGYLIDEVRVLYLSGGDDAPRIAQALQGLRSEFFENSYRGQIPCRLITQCFSYPNGAEIGDAETDRAAEHILEFAKRFLQEVKQPERQLHVSVTGGRRMMSLCLESVAPLIFDVGDRMWHLYTPAEIQAVAHEGNLMHLDLAAMPLRSPALVRVPILPLGQYYSSLLHFPLSFERMSERLLQEEDRLRCEVVYLEATPRQREVLQLYAQGFSPQDIAAALSIAEETVSSHTRVLLALVRNAWDMPAEKRLTYSFLQYVFQSYPFPSLSEMKSLSTRSFVQSRE